MTLSTGRGMLDTHTFLWWNQEPSNLSPTVRAILSDPNSRLFLSVIVLWELQIKVQTGKLSIAYPLSELARIQERDSRVSVLPVTSDHILALDGLPLLHKDPFDRLLIAQTLVEGATLLTADASVSAYPVPTLW